MAQIRVSVVDAAGSRRNEAELPDDVPMSRLVPALVAKMGLPVTDRGDAPLCYHLFCMCLGRSLRPDETLASAGVQEWAELRVIADFGEG